MKVSIRVKSKSGRSEIVEERGAYVAYLKSVPDKGKANLELLKIARKFFGKEVRIVSGFTSKDKVLEII
tara:strand:- start:1707 stop:1913 length:207 start_codon:yes stop_codon:yes gene_type:complete